MAQRSAKASGWRTVDCRWQSRVDSGDQAVAVGTLFLPLEGTVVYAGELARSLLRRDDTRASVVGGSKLTAERVATLSLTLPPNSTKPWVSNQSFVRRPSKHEGKVD